MSLTSDAVFPASTDTSDSPASSTVDSAAGPVQKLIFTTNSVRNTTLATHDNLLYYEIVTRFWHPTLTKINVLEPDTQIMRLVAEIEQVNKGKWTHGRYRVRFLDSVAPGEELGQWITDIDFLRPSHGGVGGCFTDPQGNEYRWKTHNRRLQLVRADDQSKTPLVEYEPHRRYFLMLLMYRHASWNVEPQVVGFLDRLIVSYILVERRRRAERELIDRIV